MGLPDRDYAYTVVAGGFNDVVDRVGVIIHVWCISGRRIASGSTDIRGVGLSRRFKWTVCVAPGRFFGKLYMSRPETRIADSLVGR